MSCCAESGKAGEGTKIESSTTTPCVRHIVSSRLDQQTNRRAMTRRHATTGAAYPGRWRHCGAEAHAGSGVRRGGRRRKRGSFALGTGKHVSVTVDRAHCRPVRPADGRRVLALLRTPGMGGIGLKPWRPPVLPVRRPWPWFLASGCREGDPQGPAELMLVLALSSMLYGTRRFSASAAMAGSGWP